jgi:GcrA cell cycle regulator
MSWTDERVELLKKLWTEGLSASQIAGRMGGVTRNAVIGKVHRLGLSGRATPSRSPRPRGRKTRQPSHPSQASHFHSSGSAALKADTDPQPDVHIEPEPQPIREVEIPPGQRATILTLNEHTCRWPVGDPGSEDFYFCGSNPKSGQPYCEYHCQIAYQPLQDRRRQRRAIGGR